MRHVRILNLFISSILPTSIKIQRKSITTCLSCGKFQTNKILYQQRNHTQLVDNSNLTKKFANAHVNSRPAEPSIAINKLSTQGRANEALAIYLKLLAEGGFPSRESLYQLIRGLYKSNNLIGMYAVHDTLISFYSHNTPSKRSARAMIYMYTMLINLIANNTRPVDMTTITQLCKEMNQFNGEANIVLYNTLIKSLLNQGQLESAHAMLTDLKRNTQPTLITFGIFMKDASKRKDIPTMLRYLDEIEQSTMTPDYAIVSILVTTLCHMHEFDKAKEMVEKVHKAAEAGPFIGTKFKLQLLRSIELKRNRHHE
jgi:pentatricopeptide repeat protein